MWIVIELATSLIENMIIADFVSRYLGYKADSRKIEKYIIFVILLSIPNIIFEHFYTKIHNITAPLHIICCIIFAFIFLQSTPFNKIFVSILSSLLIMFINIPLLSIFSKFLDEDISVVIASYATFRLLLIFISKSLYFIVTRIILAFRKKSENSLSRLQWLLFLTIFISTFCIGIYFNDILYKYGQSDHIQFLAVILGLGAINIITYYLLVIISKDNNEKLRLALLELQVTDQENSVIEANNKYEEILKIRHDMRSYVNCSLSLLREGKYDDAEEYLSQISYDKIGSVIQHISTPSNVINAVVNSNLTQCLNLGIDIDCIITGTVEKFSDMDLSILLSNLFSNAIEACEKNKNKSKVQLEIFDNKGYLNIVLKNTIGESVLNTNPKLLTSKKDKKNHGLGLLTVNDIVKKYNGMKSFYEQNDIFISDIWLKIE